jgi:hypothetical protein
MFVRKSVHLITPPEKRNDVESSVGTVDPSSPSSSSEKWMHMGHLDSLKTGNNLGSYSVPFTEGRLGDVWINSSSSFALPGVDPLRKWVEDAATDARTCTIDVKTDGRLPD